MRDIRRIGADAHSLRAGFAIATSVLLVVACGSADPTRDAEPADVSSASTSTVATAPTSPTSSTGVPTVTTVPTTTGPTDTDTPATSATSPTAPTTDLVIEVPATSTAPATGEAPSDIVDDLITLTAERHELDPASITVVSSIAKVWTDGSLGCAEPGIVYTQEVTSGFEVELATADQTWNYRVRDNGTALLCDS